MEAATIRAEVGFVRVLAKNFVDLKDVRVVGHSGSLRSLLLVIFMIAILMIAILAVFCNDDDWPEVEEFGARPESWHRKFLLLPIGIPSHNTFRREVLD